MTPTTLIFADSEKREEIMLHGDITKKIIGAFFNVNNALGFGFL